MITVQVAHVIFVLRGDIINCVGGHIDLRLCCSYAVTYYVVAKVSDVHLGANRYIQ